MAMTFTFTNEELTELRDAMSDAIEVKTDHLDDAPENTTHLRQLEALHARLNESPFVDEPDLTEEENAKFWEYAIDEASNLSVKEVAEALFDHYTNADRRQFIKNNETEWERRFYWR